MPDTTLVLESTIICPNCGHRATETMPTEACQYFYDCKACGALLKPKSGDCCVFCSYGSVPCPPIQAGGGAPTCCAGDAAAVEIRPGVQRQTGRS
ncbi:GDCCVxC domain-containing (seleno)protein [Pseudochelatococcus lubricantis]|uniref:GDCCVxC domain-containing (seleno)protein n=1 Tax=Pseudochelatococcus TaxID=1654719 RepID=UPI0035ECD17D